MFEKVATIYESLRECLDQVQQCIVKKSYLVASIYRQWDTALVIVQLPTTLG